MRFRRQLILGIQIQIAIVFVVAATAVTTLVAVTRESADETRRTFRDVTAIDRVQILSEELVVSVRGYLLTGAPDYLARATENRRRLDEALELLRASASQRERVDVVAEAVTAYERAIDTAAAERDRVGDLAALEQLYELRMAPERARLRDSLLALQDHGRARLAAISEDEQRLTSIVSITVAAGALLAITLSILLGVRTGKRLAAQYRSLQQAKAEAAEAARMRKELLDIVSHDLRSPLSTILLGLDAAKHDGQLANLGAIENAAQRMRRLVDDLLDAARAESYGLELVLKDTDSHELLRLTAEMFAKRAERDGIELRVEPGAHAVLIADQDRVLQILANLVANALKVTPRGGSVVLAAEPTDRGVRFTVHDSGPGITEDEVPALFDAYQQGRERARRGSLGLGLYISKTLANAHGGRIGVESEIQHGSTFWLELPCRPAAAVRA